MARRGFNVVVYLDDFLVVGEDKPQCQLAYDTLMQLLQDLGFRLSAHKLVPPTQRLIFLGVQLDSTACTMSLPQDKLADLQELLVRFKSMKRASRKQLQRLAGKLNWACRTVYGGRTFLRRILDTMNSLSNTAKLQLDKSFHCDINWWVNFLKVFNGTRLFLNRTPTIDAVTDACPLAAGGYFRGDWFYHHFELDSPTWASLHINHKETLAIILAAKRWASLWANQHVIIHSDNQAAVYIINKGTTANELIMGQLRELFWLSATFNFRITAEFIKGINNSLADAISRLHEAKHVINFYNFLTNHLDTVPLADHMSVK